MAARTVQGLITDIVYSADQVADLSNPDMVARCADSMINRRHFSGTPQEYAAAIDATLRDGNIPEHARGMSRQHSEAELLDFLARLARQLDDRRPWPRPAFVKLPADRWPEFANARAIARVTLPTHQIVGRLNKDFDTVTMGARELPVIILDLRSGEVVALMGSLEPRSTTFSLLQRDPGDAADVIAHFCEFTGIPPEAVERIDDAG